MTTPTYTPLANITLTGTAATVTFSSITGYRDLVLVINGGVTSRTSQRIVINSDTNGANYFWVQARGTGTTTGSTSSNDNEMSESIDSTLNSVIAINVMDFSASDKQKTILIRSNSVNQGTEMRAMRYASTSAGTSLQVTAGSSTWLSGSTFSLFGVAA